MTYAIGVDLGLTRTAVAVNLGRTVRMARLGEDADCVPSVVCADADGTLFSGPPAGARAGRPAVACAREVKRRLGDPTPVVLGGTAHPPAELLAAQLADVVRTAVRREGGRAGTRPADVVLTCPTVWGPYRREQFAEVARLAGLPDARVVTEAQAAVAHFAAARAVAPGDTVVVYDLGGGTLDVAVVRVGADGGAVLGEPGGLEHFGGADLDHAVLEHVDDVLGGAVGRLDPADPADAAVLAGVERACTAAKEALSTAEQTVLPVELPTGRHEVLLTRATFERLVRPLLAATPAVVRTALESADLTLADVDALLLVGGSAAIPLVGRTLAEELGLPVRGTDRPGAAVALGAAALTDARPATVGPAYRTRWAAGVAAAVATVLVLVNLGGGEVVDGARPTTGDRPATGAPNDEAAPVPPTPTTSAPRTTAPTTAAPTRTAPRPAPPIGSIEPRPRTAGTTVTGRIGGFPGGFPGTFPGRFPGDRP
jgi:molecular chaperone DnaK (HSP70)